MEPPQPKRRSWDAPLSARQLVIVLLVLGALVGLAISAHNSERDQRRLADQADCYVFAPHGWDCEDFPTGYPGYSPAP